MGLWRTRYDWALGVRDQGGQGCGRTVTGVAEYMIVDGKDHGGQEQGHMYLFRVAFVI